MFCRYLILLLTLLFVHTNGANIRNSGMCLSLYMLDGGAPGTPTANAAAQEAADAAAQVAEGKVEDVEVVTTTSFVELIRSTQRNHITNCMAKSSLGTNEPCHKALPSALYLMKTHLKREATKWFTEGKSTKVFNRSKPFKQ